MLALPLLALGGIILGAVVAGRALPAWWTLGCNRGHAYACYAAGGVTEGAESDALDRARVRGRGRGRLLADRPSRPVSAAC